MTDTYVETLLTNHFKTLETLTVLEDGSYPEVAFPNEAFERPEDGYWYELYFIPAEPFVIELGAESRQKWIGIMQINICVPKNSGIIPLNDRFDDIAKLFKSGLIIEGVRIAKTYRSTALDDGDYYVMPVTIEWSAYMEK